VLWDPLNFWPAGRRWIWAILALVSCSALTPLFVFAVRPPQSVTIDFFQEWASARNWLNGLPIYTEHRQTLPLYLGQTDVDDLYVNVNAHPPTSVLLAIPFAYLDFVDARFAWNLISLGMMAVSLGLIGRGLGIPFPAWAVFPTVTLLLTCGPLFVNLALGQLNLLLLLLIASSWAADRSGRPWLAGALLGTAAAIKLFPSFLFVYFAVRRQWRVVAAGACALALVTGLTMALLGQETYRSYVQDVLPRVASFRSAWDNASLPGFWTKLFDPATPQEHVQPLWRNTALAQAGAAICVAAVVVVLIPVIRRAKTRIECDHAYGLSISAMLLVSPLTWDHYFLLLPLPIATLWALLPPSPPVRGLFLGSLMAMWLWLFPVYNAFIPGGRTGGMATPVHTLTILSFQCYALVTFFGLGVVAALRGWDSVLTAGVPRASESEAHFPNQDGPPKEQSCAMVPPCLTGHDGGPADPPRPFDDGRQTRW
jgi:hypothetical protein